MKLAVSHDAQGNITTMFDPEKLRGDKVTMQYVPAKGEQHHILDVPKEFEGRTFEDLPKLLRVGTGGGQPRLEKKG
jgi:hypothetical protein